MPDVVYFLLIPLLPLLSFLVFGIFGRSFKSSAGFVGTCLIFVSAALSAWVAYGYFFHYGLVNGAYQKIIPIEKLWLPLTAEFSINMGILLDPISVMMLVVISFVSLMVHVYSLAYMKGEKRFAVYCAFLGLFTFSMLGLVVATNIFQMYFFWELVGVSSFLLIGFYYEKPAAVAASKKAFIVTRFADLGFLLGILMLSYYGHSLNFDELITRLSTPGSAESQQILSDSFAGLPAISIALLLVFAGAAGKSAMFPLHIWLPDAMEGPTPVSALIHAATMVVAGVYLVARLFPIFSAIAPDALGFVAFVGIYSALFAAVIACTQNDIKRVLAYSTMSQIGFMMFSLGVAGFGGEKALGYSASMFHLFTHAMFKALLFLCAGAVIHFVHSNDMKDMGGLRKLMPVTHICFLIGCLAISGIPPFSGFFSKEEILLAAYQHNKAIYGLTLLISCLTAFYMFRLYFNIFWQKDFQSSHTHHGEGGWLILLPLILCAVAAAGAGFLPFSLFVTADGIPRKPELHFAFSVLPVGLAIIAILLAAMLYKSQNQRPAALANRLKGLYLAAYHKFYIDELYLFITKKIVFGAIAAPVAWLDKNVVDGMVNGFGGLTEWTAAKIKGLQSGKLQGYAMLFLVGALALAAIFIYARN